MFLLRYCDIFPSLHAARSTVAAQYSSGAGRWSHLVTAHGVAGEGVLRGIHKAIQEGGQGEEEQRGVLLVAQMSCEGNLVMGFAM